VPLFVREGAIIPQQPVMDHVGQQPVTSLDVQVFPSNSETAFSVYEDDGETYGYEQGAYFLQALSVRREGNVVNFRTAAPAGRFKPALQDYVLAIHGATANAVSTDGKPLPAVDSLDALRASKTEGWAHGRDRFGEVTYVKVEAGKAKTIQLNASAVQP
jgi:hypothetical protein